MRGIGFAFVAGVSLIVVGWRMLNENIGSLRRGEGMYDAASRTEAAWSGTLMAMVGLVLLLVGLGVTGAMLYWLFT